MTDLLCDIRHKTLPYDHLRTNGEPHTFTTDIHACLATQMGLAPHDRSQQRLWAVLPLMKSLPACAFLTYIGAYVHAVRGLFVMTQQILHRLQERVKELSALHETARIMQAADQSPQEVVRQIVSLLPSAWQYPSVAEARIQFQRLTSSTEGFRLTPWLQRADIAVRGGQRGVIEVVYTEERPSADEGPFLKEERALINSLAEMLRSYFQHQNADEQLREAHRSLEHEVNKRTEELAHANRLLSERIEVYAKAQDRIERYQRQLRQLASQLAAVEARERRVIAIDLHDHIGQALAFIKMNVARLQGNAAFCGFESEIAETLSLLNQTIRYTRDLTCQISPPVLYELGLSSALRWLTDHFQTQHKITVKVEAPTSHRQLPDGISAVVFKSVQELVTNAIKHASARSILIRLEVSAAELAVEVKDDGSGFEVKTLDTAESFGDHFGLFNIREQITHLGGHTTIESSPDRGTSVTLSLPC